MLLQLQSIIYLLYTRGVLYLFLDYFKISVGIDGLVFREPESLFLSF